MKRRSFSQPSQRRQQTLLAALASGLIAACAAFAADTTPPELKALAFTPVAIDTSTSAVEVMLRFTVADDASGVNHIEVAFRDPSGASHRSTSANFVPTVSGYLTAKVTFPRFSAPGTWILSSVFLSDAARNTLLLDTEALTRLGFPTRLEVRSTRDTTSPKLSRLEFTPARIDTSVGPADVKVSFEATDDLSGVSYLELVFVSPSGAYRKGGPSKFEPVRSLSDALTVTFPRRSEAGQWKLRTVFLADAAGNTSILDAEALAALGVSTWLEVVSAQDTVSPKLVALDFAPASIDTGVRPADVKVNFAATDDLSGVNYIEISFVSPSGSVKRGGSAKFEAAQSVSKSINVNFPRLSEPGKWTLASVFLADAAGNTLTLDTDGLASIASGTTLEVQSAADTASPKLTDFRFAPDDIDTTRGPATVRVEFTATDDLSGVSFFEIAFVSPSGVTILGGSKKFSPAREVTDSVAVSFPKSSEPGAWRLSQVSLADAAGNTLILDADVIESKSGKTLQVR